MNALSRAFKTDVASLSQASERFSQIVTNSQGSKAVAFNESKSFSQDVDVSTNIKGLIGVQLDVYTAKNGTVHVCARMNRAESARRYSNMVRENTAIIDSLLTSAGTQHTLEAYARLSFAYSLALVTDNFQLILEVLDSAATRRRPDYGSANAIKESMIECASRITIGIVLNTAQAADKNLITAAFGSFFKNKGFRTDDAGNGNYVLRANLRLEDISQNVISSRFFFDASLQNRAGISLFSFTENERKAHPNSASEARRLALQAVETSIKEEKFAKEFDKWLNGFIE